MQILDWIGLKVYNFVNNNIKLIFGIATIGIVKLYIFNNIFDTNFLENYARV